MPSRWRYFVTTSFIGWAQTKNQSWNLLEVITIRRLISYLNNVNPYTWKTVFISKQGLCQLHWVQWYITAENWIAIAAYLLPSHYLNQCWLITERTTESNIHQKLCQNSDDQEYVEITIYRQGPQPFLPRERWIKRDVKMREYILCA